MTHPRRHSQEVSESGFRARSTGSPQNLPTPGVTVGSLGPLPLPLKGGKEQFGLYVALQVGPGGLGLVSVPGSALVPAGPVGSTGPASRHVTRGSPTCLGGREAVITCPQTRVPLTFAHTGSSRWHTHTSGLGNMAEPRASSVSTGTRATHTCSHASGHLSPRHAL